MKLSKLRAQNKLNQRDIVENMILALNIQKLNDFGIVSL